MMEEIKRIESCENLKLCPLFLIAVICILAVPAQAEIYYKVTVPSGKVFIPNDIVCYKLSNTQYLCPPANPIGYFATGLGKKVEPVPSAYISQDAEYVIFPKTYQREYYEIIPSQGCDEFGCWPMTLRVNYRYKITFLSGDGAFGDNQYLFVKKGNNVVLKFEAYWGIGYPYYPEKLAATFTIKNAQGNIVRQITLDTRWDWNRYPQTVTLPADTYSV
ncbi:MAG: hypothetical protein QXZ17_09085, partial [Nitrososphaerota archaeon]